jgi:flagellin-like protein
MTKKRGLSPVIATAMLIALVVVLASIVFLWARGFISEQIEKFNQPIELQCEKTEWKINVIKSSIGYILEISNRGNVPIYGLAILKKGVNGNEEISTYDNLNLDAGSSTEITVSFNQDDGTASTEVNFYPTLIGSVIKDEDTKKSYVCSSNIKKYTVS